MASQVETIFRADPLSKQDLETVIATATAMRAALEGKGGVAAPSSGEQADLAERFIEALWDRCGKEFRGMIRAAAEMEGEFRLADIAKAMNEDPAVVKAWMANIGRSLYKVRDELPELEGAGTLWNRKRERPQFWVPLSKGSYHVYTVRDDVRAAVLRREI